jgi:crotonobetainyl-CoA:carnitine CoA-transferase CaiB-like acyl-CoA transferase
VACFSDKWFHNFCQAVDRTNLITDPRFITNEQRLTNAAALEALIQDACAQYDAPELLRRLDAADVIHGPVLSYAQAVDDPQLQHNRMVQAVEHANVGKLPTHGIPIKLHITPGAVRQAAPTLGQHTNEVLEELGYTAAEIAALYASKAITPRAPVTTLPPNA